jgi:hypothetical protein
MNKEVSEIVVSQRIRNRIMEYFELASSKEGLLEYQDKIKSVNILSELANQWEDWFSIEGFKKSQYVEPIYTKEECNALLLYHETWNKVFDEIPTEIETIEQFVNSSWWSIVQGKAKSGLAVFMKRGYFNEEEPEKHNGRNKKT